MEMQIKNPGVVPGKEMPSVLSTFRFMITSALEC